MMIEIASFAGINPIVAPHLLKPNEAQTAKNCLLVNGTLKPIKIPSGAFFTDTKPVVNTIYRVGQAGALSQDASKFWLTFANTVNVIKGPIIGDTTERIYYTGAGTPRKTNGSLATGGAYPSGSGTAAPFPVAYYELGVPAPTNAPVAAVAGTATHPATDVATDYLYVVTYVTTWGEESAPTALSNAASVKPGQTVNLTGMNAAAPAGNYSIASKNIYRSNTGSSATDLQFLANIPLAQTTYSDAVSGNVTPAENLGEVLTTRGYLEPPTNLAGLTLMAQGITVGFIPDTGTVCFTPVSLPYAWPIDYRRNAEYNIVALASFGQSVVALTNGNPYIITGTDPQMMSCDKLPNIQPCMAAKSVAVMEGGVVYAGPEGLVMVNENGARVLTSGIIDKQTWIDNYFPSTMKGFAFGSYYIGFYLDNLFQEKGIIVDLSGQSAILTTTDAYSDTGFYDAKLNRLLLLDHNTMAINGWNYGSNNATFEWKSKIFRGSPRNYAVGRVKCSGTVTAYIYADGALKHTQTVTNDDPFRLPAGFLARDWEIKLTGTGTVDAVMIATDVLELKDR